MAFSETEPVSFTFQMRPSFPVETPSLPSFRTPPSSFPTGAHEQLTSSSSVRPPHDDGGKATGKGPQFQHTRQAHPTGMSPQSSSPSSVTSMRSLEDLEALEGEALRKESVPPHGTIREDESSFTLEELGDSDLCGDSDMEVIQPDHYEEVDSDWIKEEKGKKNRNLKTSQEDYLDQQTDIVRDFQSLCSGSDGFNLSSSPAGQDRKYRQRKKRWSAGIFKRSYSQSVASDTDGDDEMDASVSEAKRLRRRVDSKGSMNRRSLIFDDLGPNMNFNELDEHEEANHMDVEDSGDYIMGVLPFWVIADMMQVDSDTDH